MNKIRNFVVVLMLVAQGSALFSMDSQPGDQESKSTSLCKRKRNDDAGSTQGPDEKKRKTAVLPIKLSCEASLKQADKLGHTLHCGYYALWNALCSVSTGGINGKHVDQESFKNDLGLWEAKVRHKRSGQVGFVASFISHIRALVSTDTNVNNLETDELDYLVDNLVKAGLLQGSAAEPVAENLATADNVTVFASKNQMSQLIEGHGLSSALLERIRKFRQDGLPQAFLINTGADNGQKQSGGFHWIAAVLTRLPVQIDNCDYSLKFYDSGSVPKSSQSKTAYYEYCQTLKPMVSNIHELFIEQNLELLTARSLLASDLHAVTVYSDQAENIKKSSGDPLFWELDVYSDEYIKFLEDYVRCCIKAVVPEFFKEFNQKVRLARAKRDKARYIKYLRSKFIPAMHNELKIKNITTNWTKFDALDKHIPMLQEYARELAINKLTAVYQKFVINADVNHQINQDIFRLVVLEFGIPEIMINALIAPVQAPVVNEPVGDMPDPVK